MSDAKTASTVPPEESFLATGRGKAILSLLCLATFLDVMDGAIVNVAMPTIRTHLGFSVQNLQWVISGYLITYGGFLLLGGRAGDLVGRRRLLIAGTALFAAASLACGLADSQGLLVGGRLVQGFGAAMMTPAALSILTTTFQGTDRHKALGAWAGISGMASAVGMLVGGTLTQEFGWRWVFFISLPLAALVLLGTFRLLAADHGRPVPGGFDAVGAVLVTASMLLLIFTLVNAPDEGWGAGRTIGGLAGAAVLMAAFAVNEQRRAHPLVPLSIFRVKGLAAADATQVIAWAGFWSMFFFITLYMQDVLGFTQLETGLSYLPVSVGIGFGSTVATKMFIRTGTRPIIVSGALLAAGGIFWLSRIPVDGTYLGNLLAPLVIMGVGLGLLYAGVQTAANAGVPADQAGLAAALITASFQLGSALGLAVFSG
ncbi:MAG: MFS transporter, partial [Trebonia sp.]